MKFIIKLSFLFIFNLSFSQSVTLNFVGDIMPGTSFPDSSYLPLKNWRNLFDNVSSVLKKANYTTGNLEGVLLNGNLPSKNCRSGKHCFSFKIPTNYSSILVNAGFDAVNLANNHCLDFGMAGVDSTRKTLKKAGIGYCGLYNDKNFVYKTGTTTICQLGFSSYSLSYSIKDKMLCKKMIEQAKAKSDIIIVMFHGGAEGKNSEDLPRTGEKQFGVDHGSLVEFARYAIDCGADIVVGSGPHVLRGMELYKNRLIAYSLGNFCTYAAMNIQGNSGVGAILSVKVEKDGSFESGQIVSTKQIGRGIPMIDNSHMGALRMKELSALDFPESYLAIDDTGKLYKATKNNMNECKSGDFHVVVGSFQQSEASLNQIETLKSAGYSPSIVHYFDPSGKLLYRISVSEFDSYSNANAYMNSNALLKNKSTWIYKCQ